MKKIIITIGREFGSGGHAIGKTLAQELNIPCFDKELLRLAAEESGLSLDVVENIDETAMNSLLYSLSVGAYLPETGYAPRLDLPVGDRIFLIQSEIIKREAKNGPCIFVGRCADYILEGTEDILKVFIHAPASSRINRISKINEISIAEAKRLVNKTDKRRAGYYSFYTDKKWGRRENYHLCIDASTSGIDGAVEMIKTLAIKKFSR